MAKVFITQVPHRRDKETGALAPSVNIGPAYAHGDPVTMLPPQASFYATSDLIDQLSNHLSSYDYEAGDALLALGDPVVIGAASALLGKKFGRFAMLKWDRQLGVYLKVQIKLHN